MGATSASRPVTSFSLAPPGHVQPLPGFHRDPLVQSPLSLPLSSPLLAPSTQRLALAGTRSTLGSHCLGHKGHGHRPRRLLLSSVKTLSERGHK